MKRSLLASRQKRRGAAAVEFALLLPLLCFLFVGTVDFCRVYYYSITVSNCARNGALFGSADANQAQNANGIVTAARKDASNLDVNQMQVTSATDGSTYVAVTVAYPFATVSRYPGIPSPLTLSRTVRMNILPATPTFH
jgi:Flp pilus assembly protein TadG